MAAPDPFSVVGQRALVTGAASGLGSAVAAALARAGADVVLADIDSDGVGSLARELTGDGCRAAPASVDVTDKDAVEAVARELAVAGGVDILVNSAGTNTWMPAVDVSATHWQEILDVNLTGTFNCCQAIGSMMIAQGGGSIVNMTSVAGLVGHAGVVAYAASKGGVVQVTKTLALEWASHGVRVNALAPCMFDTRLVARNRSQHPEIYARLLEKIPLGRAGRVEEIVGPALFLASNAASMVTGHILAVDGGYVAQ